MSAVLAKLEAKLEGVFVKNAPFQLPKNAQDTLVKIVPWLNLAGGILFLLTARALWSWARATSTLADYVNDLNRIYGGADLTVDRFSTFVWLGIIILVVEAVLYLWAFPLTKSRKKLGWDLMVYALLVNLVYGVVIAFTDYGGFFSLFSALVGSVIGLYLLFQIRAHYR